MSAHEQERLSAWLDGELAPRERAEVEAHLAECESCGAFVAQLRALDEAARSLPTEVPDGYFDRLPARVRARIEARRSAGRGLPAWTWAAAAALLLAVVTPLTLRELRSPGAERQLPPAGMAAPAPSRAPENFPVAPTALPPPTSRPLADRTAPTAQAKRETDAFARAPEHNVAGTRSAPAPEAATPKLTAAPVEAKTRVDEPAPASAEEETAASVEGGAPGGVVGGQAGAEPASGAALQQSVRDRMQAPTMVAVAPPVGAIAEATASPVPAAPGPQKLQDHDPAEIEFQRLGVRRPRTLEEWRRVREDWRTYVASFPHGARADEARVRTIEAGFEAWKKGGENQDAAVFLRDRNAYLERPDALQRERVRRLR